MGMGTFLGERFSRERSACDGFIFHAPSCERYDDQSQGLGKYANSTLAKTLAKRAGFDETIMLDAHGYVAECSGENIFMVRNGIVYTPPRTTVLEGNTRDSLLTLANDLDIQVVEEHIARDQLYAADEIFLVGTAAEVVPVREVDFRVIGKDKNWPITRALQKAYHEVVRGQGDRSCEWLDFVDETVYAV